jgi:glycine hydroxymethyltransferase
MTDMTTLAQADPVVADLIAKDVARQRSHIQLIASENFVSYAMMEASGSVLANKYSEGYPGRRYYEGCQVVDEIETLAIERAKAVFGADHANVQAHSGSQANMAAYLAVLEPGDTILGMALDQGGHLTHGSHVNFSGILFNFVAYGLDPETEKIDFDDVRALALEHKPKMIVAGYSSYSQIIDWSEFRAIADEIGAILLVDAAHIIGLIAGGAHPSPVPYADIVTATTHKALRGPRGGLILCKSEYAKAIDKAVFPTSQGGAINHQIAGKALCFKQVASPEYAEYAAQIVSNASTLADTMTARGVRVISGGTQNHMFMIDLRSIDEELTGKVAATLLDDMGVTLNRNAIPFDPRSPFVTSGLRMGTAAVTTAGMKEPAMVTLGNVIVDILVNKDDDAALSTARAIIIALTTAFPSYPIDFPGYVGN